MPQNFTLPDTCIQPETARKVASSAPFRTMQEIGQFYKDMADGQAFDTPTLTLYRAFRDILRKDTTPMQKSIAARRVERAREEDPQGTESVKTHMALQGRLFGIYDLSRAEGLDPAFHPEGIVTDEPDAKLHLLVPNGQGALISKAISLASLRKESIRRDCEIASFLYANDLVPLMTQDNMHTTPDLNHIAVRTFESLKPYAALKKFVQPGGHVLKEPASSAMQMLGNVLGELLEGSRPVRNADFAEHGSTLRIAGEEKDGVVRKVAWGPAAPAASPPGKSPHGSSLEDTIRDLAAKPKEGFASKREEKPGEDAPVIKVPWGRR